MNRYLMVCRLRWPALLLLTGVIALLNQMGVMSWGHAWPLYLILLGVLALAERAALAAEPVPPPGYPPYAGYDSDTYAPGPGSYQGSYQGPYPGPAQSAPASASKPASTGIVPAANSDIELRSSESQRESRKGWDQEER